MTADEHAVVVEESGEQNSATNGQVYARIVTDLRELIGTDDLARAVGVHARQVQNWAGGRNRPQSGNRDQLLEVNYLVQRLREVYQPEGVEIWLRSRNREFDGQRPLDLLAAGNYTQVLAAVERLADGTPS